MNFFGCRVALVAGWLVLFSATALFAAEELPGTAPWTATGDLGASMVDGIHRWLDRATAAAPTNRAKRWTVAIPSKNGAPVQPAIPGV